MKEPSLLLLDLGGVLVENAGFGRLNRLLPRTAPLRVQIAEHHRKYVIGLTTAASVLPAP